MRKCLCAVLLYLAAFSVQAAIVTIEFDDPSLPTDGLEEGFVTEGFQFTFGPLPIPNPPAYVTNTSTGLLAYCPGCFVEFGAADSSEFGLIEFDAAIFGTPADFQVTGFLAGGGTLTTSFPVSGVTQSFAIGWSGLSRVRIENLGGDPSILTRVVVDAVPVPAAVWLFGSALAGLGWLRRRQT